MKRTSPLRRSKPIRKVSTKRAKQLREYSARRVYFLRENPICQVWLRENGWTHLVSGIYHKKVTESLYVKKTATELLSDFHFFAPASTEVHHVAKRRGEMLNDERNWLAVCRHNHERIEQNKGWARANGYLTNF
jgi:hypothetical protein